MIFRIKIDHAGRVRALPFAQPFVPLILLREKLFDTFPAIIESHRNNMALVWNDSEDDIIIRTNTDLQTALHYFWQIKKDPKFKLLFEDFEDGNQPYGDRAVVSQIKLVDLTNIGNKRIKRES